MAGEWDESKHPRAEDGKFGSGSGTSTGKAVVERARSKKSMSKPERTAGHDYKVKAKAIIDRAKGAKPKDAETKPKDTADRAKPSTSSIDEEARTFTTMAIKRIAEGKISGAAVALDMALERMGLQTSYTPNSGKVLAEEMKPGVDGIRKWNGDIAMPQPTIDAMQAVAKYSQRYGVGLKDVAAHTKTRRAEINNEINKRIDEHESTVKDRAREAEIQKELEPVYARRNDEEMAAATEKYNDEWNAISERSQELYKEVTKEFQSELDDLTAAQSLAGVAADGYRVLVHEALHGFSPGSADAYSGSGAKVEEITTEVMARVVSAEAYGLEASGYDSGAYAPLINATVLGIAALSGKSGAESYEALKRASRAYKSNPARIMTPDIAVSRFAIEIAKEIGVNVASVTSATSEWLENTKGLSSET
jgi:hypothetical protein